MKKIIVKAILGIMIILLFTGCPEANNSTPGTESVTLNVLTNLSETSAMYEGLVKFKELVDQGTDNSVIVSIAYDSALNTADTLDEMKNGQATAVLVGSDAIADLVDEFSIMWGPYAFESEEDFFAFCDTATYDTWAAGFNGTGVTLLSFNWLVGSRHIMTGSTVTDPILVPGDLSDIELRVPGFPIVGEAIDAMGATATAIPWSQLHSAFENQEVDGFENQFQAIAGLEDVITRVALTGHILVTNGLLISEDWLSGLSAENQLVIRNSAKTAGSYAAAQSEMEKDLIILDLESDGVTINTVTDIQDFITATAGVYDDPSYSDYKSYKQQIDTALASE